MLDTTQVEGVRSLMDVLNSPDPVGLAKFLVDKSAPALDPKLVTVLAPIDEQEVWAAGVTYKRSQVARMEESKAGASHYDKVYTAPRPEIFFKATASRVSGPGQPLRVRADSKWSVPEPELALVISSSGKLVGFTVGNDMSARDIEGENPLYLPQAKVYNQCCGLGPFVWIPEGEVDRPATKIRLTITRGGAVAFTGETDLDQMKRGFEELVGWLVCVEGPDRGRDYPLRAEENALGRAPAMDICIANDAAVSRHRHCAIVFDVVKVTFVLLPGDSASLLYLNGESIRSSRHLKRDDVIDVGRTKLVFIPFCEGQNRWR